MRAVVANKFGSPSDLRLEFVEAQEPGPDEVRIAVAAAGVTFVDALITRGGHQGAIEFPYIPGTECAGIVDAVGCNVEHLSKGQRVFAITLRGGAFGEQVVVDASMVAIAPDGLSFDQLAIVGGTYLTAYHALAHRGSVKPGEWLLVRGASGALGTAAIQIGRALDMHVVAFASTPEKREFALRAGADAALDSRAGNIRDDMQSTLERRIVDVVFDPVGGSDATEYFRALAWGGRYLVLGFAGGAIPSLPFNLALLKGAALLGVDAGQFAQRDPLEVRQSLSHISKLLGQGAVLPQVATKLALEDFAQALELAATGASVGRIILNMTREP